MSWRIVGSDGHPIWVTSLWERWTDLSWGEIMTRFAMLAVNTDGHAGR
jgi:hypothetical protein